MSHETHDDRRRFLKQLGLTMAGGAAMSAFPQFQLVSRALAATTAPTSGYRALVCIFLFGGNDSFNMLIPHAQPEYDAYLGIRGGVYDAAANSQGLAIDRATLVPVTDTAGKTWGLNPACDGMRTLFEQGELAFLANVGTLTQPIADKREYAAGARLPGALFSHNDQQRLWMRGHSENRALQFGWGGLSADLLRNPASTALPVLPPSISLNGNNLFQAGQFTTPYGMGNQGPVALRRLSENAGNGDAIRRRALLDLLGRDYGPVMQSQYGVIGESSLAISSALGTALANDGTVATIFPPENNLGDQLKMIARTIKASRSPAVNHHRQIFFASMGGFDTHDNQMTQHTALLGKLSSALLAFRQALDEVGALNDTVTFTMSDFGRTLNSNGNGTDHGWGGVQLMMGGSSAKGGPLRGRQVWGDYPLLSLDGPRLIERGRVIPTTSNNQMAATLARWLGVDGSDLPLVFPGIGNFPTPTLGFLG